MLLLDLPIELLSFILQQLSVLDILSCRVVNISQKKLKREVLTTAM